MGFCGGVAGYVNDENHWSKERDWVFKKQK